MKYTEILKVNSPVVVRSYVSGVFVGRLQAGELGIVVLCKHRWLRNWVDVGGEGSVYDLLVSDKTPIRRGPFIEDKIILSQADVILISEKDYERLCHG